MAKRRKKKRWIGKFVVILFLIGIVGFLSFLFRKEIVNIFGPLFEKSSIVKQRREVVLFFADQDGEFLIGETRRITKKEDPKEEGKEVIDELIRGPRGKLVPTLPSRAKCLSIKLTEKGVAVVNFNKSLSKDHPGGSSAEILTAYSIVHSLTQNFPQIRQVQILIEGKPVETIAGHLSLRQPLISRPDLIKKQ
jgi:spore germination protein GerM